MDTVRLRWVVITPFGRPVVPPVGMMAMTPSGCRSTLGGVSDESASHASRVVSPVSAAESSQIHRTGR